MELEFVLSYQFSACSRIDAFLDLLRAMDYFDALICIPCDRQRNAALAPQAPESLDKVLLLVDHRSLAQRPDGNRQVYRTRLVYSRPAFHNARLAPLPFSRGSLGQMIYQRLL